MLIANQKIFGGQIFGTGGHYTTQRTWPILGIGEKLVFFVRVNSASGTGPVLKADLEHSNDGEEFVVKTSAFISQALRNSAQNGPFIFTDSGTTPNGAFVRLKLYGAQATDNILCDIICAVRGETR